MFNLSRKKCLNSHVSRECCEFILSADGRVFSNL